MLNQQEVPRQTVQGVQVLQFKNGPYIEVAERIRAVHKAGKPFSFDRGEVLRIHGRWLYRAWITVAGQQYIGDAEIHFDAPPQSPDGTNPVTCGQTSAIGNALSFAGFGTLKSILARLGVPLESEWESETDAARRMVVEGIEVALLDEQPYVTVAERIHLVHLLGKAFSIQQCKLIQYNRVWIYRAWITVEDHPYIGDAEVHFDAVQEPDRTYPISCGQTSAVGNALAFAGFGDVRSLLERWGKDVPLALQGKPLLASADALSRAQQQAQCALAQAEGVSGKDAESPGPPPSPSGEKTSSATSTQQQQRSITVLQRERIRVLCARLGETEPDYATMSEMDAEVLLVQLELSEEELLLAVDAAGAEADSQSAEVEALMSREDVGSLKVAWLEAFHIGGTKTVKREQWEQFKTRTCQHVVDDEAMRTQEYTQLLAAIVAEQERRAAQAPARQRRGTATVGRQAR